MDGQIYKEQCSVQNFQKKANTSNESKKSYRITKMLEIPNNPQSICSLLSIRYSEIRTTRLVS